AANAESLTRATSGQSLANWPAILAGFTEKGIPEVEILPRVNVFTYRAWLALGRHVRKGEKGVKVHTWIPLPDKVDEKTGEVVRGGKRPKTATVFHVSQTDPVE
ncbi:MAG: ArdC-like ssDNA-binding domain-containing protein, partial [Planctomycetota bacterium]